MFRGDHSAWNLEQPRVNKVSGKVWAFAVVLDEVVKEGNDMEALA